MNIDKLKYEEQLKEVKFEAIVFHEMPVDFIPDPYYKDFSTVFDPEYGKPKSYDEFDFRDLLLQGLSERLNDTVLKVMIISPGQSEQHYDAFAFLASKHIVALHFKYSGYFKDWMNTIFERQYERLEKKRKEGQFERQPELDPNPRFVLTLSEAEFSQTSIRSGRLGGERPYEDTGKFLFNKAPQKYNEAEIAQEKQTYLENYIDTSGADLNTSDLSALFETFLNAKQLKPHTPVNNEQVYQEFKATTGFDIPNELRVLFNSHNGVEGTGFLTADRVLKEWKNWKEIYDDWTLEDLTGNNDPDAEKTIGMYTNPYWIPFLSTGGGNFVAIDYAPGNEGKSGQIIAFGRDEDKIRFLAKNMQDFFQQFVDGKDVLNNEFDT